MKILISCLILISTALANSVSEEPVAPEIRLVNVVRGYSDRGLFGNPVGIFYDATKGEIYLADPGNHQVGIFDSKGTTLWTFKHWVTDDRAGARVLGAPHSIVVNSSGDIIVSDNQADYLDILDYRGAPMQRIQPRDYDGVVSFRGASLALDNSSNLYVAVKLEKPEILKFNVGYDLVMRFGEKGGEPHQFDSISGLMVDSDGHIFVTDLLADPVVKVFASDGSFLKGFGGREENKVDFSYAAGIASTAGRIWVVDGLRQVVKCLTPDGQFVTMIGGLGVNPGDLYHPSALTSDGDSLLFVAERLGNRYQQFVIK
jgi:DNA-binding beta-propeller fold protein YncE